MLANFRSLALLAQQVLQRVAVAAILLVALGLVGYAAAAFLGASPWLVLSLQFGDTILPYAGQAVQLGVTALMVLLCAFLPANARVMRLETSHRRFHIGMEDVGRAYRTAHAADRAGAFHLRSEFDSIRERIAFLRDHPDLTELEPPILEVAAQMSHVSRELAQVYSDRNLSRARDFLTARQRELEDFETRLDAAKGAMAEMRPWLDRIEIDEQVARAQLERLCDELAEILPEIAPADDTVAAPDTHMRDDAPATMAPAEHGTALPESDPQIVKLLARRAAE